MKARRWQLEEREGYFWAFHPGKVAADMRVLRQDTAALLKPTNRVDAQRPPDAAGGKKSQNALDAFGTEVAVPAQTEAARVDAKQAAAFGSFQKLLGALIDTGTWSRLDGAPPKWNERQLLDVAGRFGPLAMDPAKGKMSPGSVEEAAVGLAAERAGLLPGPITRESTGQAEFVDGAGKFWDVKSPVSPWGDAKWTFDAEHQVDKVKHDISQDNSVLLNLTRLDAHDTDELLATLRAKLTPEELVRVFVLTTPQVLGRE